jgi:hypothetical protein
MVNRKGGIYNSVMLSMAMLAAVGCGKPAPPPEGALQNTTAPSVDLGPETGPKESGADSPNSAPEPGTSPDAKGEVK